MNWLAWPDCFKHFASSQLFPCQKVIFDEKVFSATSIGSLPLKEILQCHENVIYISLYFDLSVFCSSGNKSRIRPSYNHLKNQAQTSIGTLLTTLKNIKLAPYLLHQSYTTGTSVYFVWFSLFKTPTRVLLSHWVGWQKFQRLFLKLLIRRSFKYFLANEFMVLIVIKHFELLLQKQMSKKQHTEERKVVSTYLNSCMIVIHFL